MCTLIVVMGPKGTRIILMIYRIVVIDSIRAVFIEQPFSKFSSSFKNRKNRRNRKHFQSLEILQRAKKLEGFAFQYLEKRNVKNMEIQKVGPKKHSGVCGSLDNKSFDRNAPMSPPDVGDIG